MKHFTALVATLLWVAGFVLAKGVWSTIFCIVPFWAYYIVIETVIGAL